MAIIKNVGFGVRDRDNAFLYFDAYISSNSLALQCLSVDEAVAMIEAYGAYDVHDLNGRACWVNVEGNLINYLEPCLI